MRTILENVFLRWAGGVTMAVLAVLATDGCSHAPAARLEGGSSFAFLEPAVTPSGSRAEMSSGPRQPVDVVVPAEPLPPLANPAYPRAALGRHQAPVMVGVRVIVDASGRVAEIGPSMRALSTPGTAGSEFLAAVEDALIQWRFTPAEKRHLVPGSGGPKGEDYWVITGAEKTEYAFDLAFTFTTAGDVTSVLAR